MKINQVTRNVIAVFALLIGLYPFLYFAVDMHSSGLLQTKPASLINNNVWSAAFFVHITAGGISLLTGWSQFNTRRRQRNLNWHRWIGRVYMIAVLLSSISGLYTAFFATGGLICAYGFSALALLWLFTDAMAYITIRRKDVMQHRRWMIINYSLTFAAVTLRLWLPFFVGGLHIDFIHAYRVVSWLCWVPNLLAAWWLSKPKETKVSVRMA